MTTDHSRYIEILREHNSIASSLAADLLDMHDTTAINLFDWDNAVVFIQDTFDNIDGGTLFVLEDNGA